MASVAVFGSLTTGLDPPGRLRGQELEQVLVQVRRVDPPRADGAQVDDAIDVQRPEVVGQAAPLQRLQDAADRRRLADPAAADHRHQPLRLVLQEVADQLRLDVAVLEVARGDGRRRVEEPGAGDARDRLRRLPLPLQAPRDALLGSLLRRFGVGDDPPLGLDLRLQLGDVIPDACLLLGTLGAAQVAFRIRQAILQRLEHAGGRIEPAQMVAQSGQGLVEVPGEVDVLAAPQAERQDGAAVVEERDDRLLVSQGPGPLELADRLVFDAVFRHDEQQARAIADRLLDLRVPVLARLDVPLVEPGRYVGRSRLQRIVELEGEVPGVGPGIADEVVTGRHRPPFFGGDTPAISRCCLSPN